jgi:OCT family organic cation transporter-like MFS transporter 18
MYRTVNRILPRMADSSLTVVYALVVLYALCYQLQSPLEPFLVEKFVKGEDAASSYARLVSFFSFMQIVGSFVVGYLLDVIGLRAMFALNFLSCAASYALLARATSIEMLFLSKVPALFQAGFLCAQTASAKLTPDGQERVRAVQDAGAFRAQSRVRARPPVERGRGWR